MLAGIILLSIALFTFGLFLLEGFYIGNYTVAMILLAISSAFFGMGLYDVCVN